MIALKSATSAHANALAHIHASAFSAGERWGADAMALQLGLPGAFGWIAKEGGMILARVAADEAEVLTLAVDPAARGRGLGRALLFRAIQTASARGARSLFLEVAATNAAARALYGGCGFVEVGRRRSYYRGGADALVLRAVIPLDQQLRDSVRAGFDREHLMTLLDGGAGDVAKRLVATELDQQDLRGLHAVEREPDADIGHRTMIAGDVQTLVNSDI